MNRPILFLIILCVFTGNLLHGQPTGYKKYTNTVSKFSFDIPGTWAVNYSKEQAGIICVPVNAAEKKLYNDCYEGIVFRLFTYKGSLEKTLGEEGYTKKGTTYTTTDRVSENVATQPIKGKNWTGIYHDNTCGIRCKLSAGSSAGGHCQFLYFSNGNTTVCITTNGKEFKDEVLKRIQSSFSFN